MCVDDGGVSTRVMVEDIVYGMLSIIVAHRPIWVCNFNIEG